MSTVILTYFFPLKCSKESAPLQVQEQLLDSSDSHVPAACEQQVHVSVNATSSLLFDWRLPINTEKTVVMEITWRPIASDLTRAINLELGRGQTLLRELDKQRHLSLIYNNGIRHAIDCTHQQRAVKGGSPPSYTEKNSSNCSPHKLCCYTTACMYSPNI